MAETIYLKYINVLHSRLKKREGLLQVIPDRCIYTSELPPISNSWNCALSKRNKVKHVERALTDKIIQ